MTAIVYENYGFKFVARITVGISKLRQKNQISLRNRKLIRKCNRFLTSSFFEEHQCNGFQSVPLNYPS